MLIYKPSYCAESNKKKERNELDAIIAMLVDDSILVTI